LSTPPLAIACLAFLEVLAQVPAWAFWLGLAALLVIAWFLRYFLLIRLPLWLWSHTLYRIGAFGRENVPACGPALLVSNHVSHIDALLIQAVLKRKVRFLIWAPYLRMPVVRWLLRLAQVIPVDSSAGPRAIIQALRSASDALAQGDMVAIFAEGGITRTGFLLPFHRGLEQIVKRSPAPIIPVCLDHVWGSIFSYQSKRFFWKRPRSIPYPVQVNFGTPLPGTASAFEVRQALQKLSADSAIRRAPARVPVHRQFVRMAARHPFLSCLVDSSNPAKPLYRYGEVLAGAKIVAAKLRPVLGEDQMVGVWLPPSAGAAITNISLAFLGKTAVNLNYTSSADLVQAAVRQCGIRHVLTSRRFTHKVPLDAGAGVKVIYLEDFRKHISRWERLRTYLSVLLVPGFLQERWLLRLGRHRLDSVATVIFSSGSTGEPKGVVLTHANIAGNADSMIQAIDPGPKDRLLGILPFFHSFGYTVTLWVPLQVGASVVYHANPLQAREIGELCRKWHCTIFLTTPTFLRTYLKRCEAGDFASLRLLICGAEKLPQALAQEFKEKFGVLPLEGYGCTELSPVAAANVPDWQQGASRQLGNKPGTIGLPLPGVAARVVDRATLQPLPPGQEGLLLFCGANVMRGYLGKEELTRQKIVDGWYITGDLARMDEDGFITLTGREERFAKVGGEMVPLERVEEELHGLLRTNERVLAVTAIPDERKGERLIVLHLPLNGTDVQQLWQQLNSRGLPNLYIPSPRDFFQVPELPLLGTGKLDIKKCKEKALELARGDKVAR
jgi:acyl-[acyl-carrier-protein]-phospholipid O-acyltransferase/long-chain-fatty-acid--[acyl-carrier-protein] ligase